MLLARKLDRHTEGILESSKFPSNYFSVSEMEQWFGDDFRVRLLLEPFVFMWLCVCSLLACNDGFAPELISSAEMKQCSGNDVRVRGLVSTWFSLGMTFIMTLTMS